ncbi:SDR family oxidoreductase [Rhodococcus artemisiae]|uniref:SDR family NAD(P)-dependent oxidoreductase n=1 Tax=Rhodococcus artemisiae TaxID=714159 RepID=A0ABU7LF37_9NOCA|nr:SDR family NAD(P)-dependent oxidoreductase [Rhodococcus artemisiae]MEE2059894.1 SDR family NAD(P)-dependent oxidoreductase [Rhodococcus artemisiae]
MELSSARHAFVTGGASGIGLGIVDVLAGQGVAVTVADVDGRARESVVAARGDGVRGVALDVRDRDAWAQAKDDSEAAFGPVDILVNNAGIGFNGQSVIDMDPGTFDNLVSIDLAGVFNGVITFGAGMRARGRGHIVNTASVMGLLAGAPGRGAYSAVKAAVIALSEAMREEMSPHGVGVSVLCPGLVKSNLDVNTARIGGHVADASAIKGAGDIGMEPLVAGRLVAHGIEENLPYILTHPHYLDRLQRRTEAILASVVPVTEGG